MIEKYFHEHILRNSKEKIKIDYETYENLHDKMEWWRTFYIDINKRTFFDAVKDTLKKSNDQEKCKSDLIAEIKQEAFEAKNILDQSNAILKFLNDWKPTHTNPKAKINPKKMKKKEHFNPEDVAETSFVKKEAHEERKRKINRWG